MVGGYGLLNIWRLNSRGMPHISRSICHNSFFEFYFRWFDAKTDQIIRFSTVKFTFMRMKVIVEKVKTIRKCCVNFTIALYSVFVISCGYLQTPFTHQQLAESFRKPVDKRAWLLSPITVNAYQIRHRNSLVFPAGLLQEPFFDTNYPNAVTYGRAGFFIGHEIFHIFDNLGVHIDKDGNAVDFWSNTTIQEHQNRFQCFIDQYNGYAEILCSNVKEEHPVNYDEHSVGRLRVIGTLSNSRNFSDAFQCREGSPMNPTEKCTIW